MYTARLVSWAFFRSLFLFLSFSFFSYFYFFSLFLFFFPIFPAQQPSCFPGHWKWDRVLWAICPTEWNCFVHMHWCSLCKEGKKSKQENAEGNVFLFLQKLMFFILCSEFNKTKRLQTSFLFEIFHIFGQTHFAMAFDNFYCATRLIFKGYFSKKTFHDGFFLCINRLPPTLALS